jgi:hypothetical protein
MSEEFDRKTAGLRDLLLHYYELIYSPDGESFDTWAVDMTIRQRFGKCFVLRDELSDLNYYFRSALSRPNTWFRYEGTHGLNTITLID